MKTDRFYLDSFIVTISNLVTGIVGFGFSIVLSRNLGTEGLGLYGLIMPVYMMFLGIGSDGLVSAVSRITAVYCSRKDTRNINRSMSTIFAFIAMWSTSIALLVFIGSPFISTHLIRDARSLTALKVMCPALLFVPLSAILKGYFYGTGKFKITALTDILEKVLRVSALIFIISMLSLNSISATVAAAYSALSLGEFASFSILFGIYSIYRKHRYTSVHRVQNRLQLLFNILAISSPLWLNGLLSSLISMASTLVLPGRLASAGFLHEDALSLIGKFMGMALNITGFPSIIIGSISIVLIPDLSISSSKNNFWEVEGRILQVLKISVLAGIATLAVCLSIPDDLGRIFYNRSDLGSYIRFAAISSLFGFIASPTIGILNGLGKQNILLRNSLIVSLQGLLLVYMLAGIPSINIYGCGISMILTSLTLLALNIHEIRKICTIEFPLRDAVVYCITGIAAYLVLKIMTGILPDTLLLLKTTAVILAGFSLVFLMPGIAGKRISG